MMAESITSPAPAAWSKPLAKYENDLLTVENMAEVLDTSTRTIYRLADNDDLPHVKVGLMDMPLKNYSSGRPPAREGWTSPVLPQAARHRGSSPGRELY